MFEDGQFPGGRRLYDATFYFEHIAFGNSGAGYQEYHRSAGSGVVGAGSTIVRLQPLA